MSLYVDTSSGVDSGSVTTDLFTISWNDGNLGQGADTTIAGSLNGIASIPATPVTYPAVGTGQASANRLLTLVSTTSGDNWSNPIVITPLAGGTDPYSGIDITANGLTYLDTGVTPNVIHVVYDTSQGNGQGISAFDTGGNPIQTPNAVILYHELSHAYHHAINQSPFPQMACPGVTSDEPAAEIDENVLRGELGLCLRDVCNHGTQAGWGASCGGSATPGGPALPDGSGGSGGGNGGCFIVTASLGTSATFEVLRLRNVRDLLADRSDLARRLIDAIYADYAQFAPAVAAQIAPDAGARALVRQLIVDPLFAWFSVAECLVSRSGNLAERGERIDALFAACPSGMAQMVAPLIEGLLDGTALAAASSGMLGAFAPGLSTALERPFVRWALLDALRSAWALGRVQRDVVQAAADWLAQAPMDRLAPPPPSSLAPELKQLASLYEFAPAARAALGSRLAVAWPSAVDALEQHGFVRSSIAE